MTAHGSIEEINEVLRTIFVRPSCEAPGAKVTYVYTIEAAVRRDTDQVMLVGIEGIPSSSKGVTAQEPFNYKASY